eukprot:5961356-Pyramimonas_sp.AAC.1
MLRSSIVTIFVQPTRIRVDGTSYLRTPRQLDQHGVTTVNAKSRAKYWSGLRDTSVASIRMLPSCPHRACLHPTRRSSRK